MNLQDTLARLSVQFVARDIMVPKDDLKWAADEKSARALLKEHSLFDVIPICHKRKVVAFLEREASKHQTIYIQHLVSSETPILELVDSFLDRQHVFVVGQHEVIGLLHFSDLNDPVVKLPFFVLLESLERLVADRIRDLVDEESLASCIEDPERVSKIRKKMNRMRKQGADRDYVTLMHFGEILQAAVHLKRLRIKRKQIEDLTVVRNRVAHAAADELVESKQDVRRLNRAKQVCHELLAG